MVSKNLIKLKKLRNELDKLISTFQSNMDVYGILSDADIKLSIAQRKLEGKN
jgi:hypothetical protein